MVVVVVIVVVCCCCCGCYCCCLFVVVVVAAVVVIDVVVVVVVAVFAVLVTPIARSTPICLERRRTAFAWISSGFCFTVLLSREGNYCSTLAM